MKKTILLVAVVLIGSTCLFANSIAETNLKIETKQSTRKATFGVRGNCGMCKKTIETAALKVKGVESASWNKEKKEITVVFTSEASLIEIHKAIAAVGYDTDKVMAKKNTYNKLPDCCQYDRTQEMRQKSDNHSHEGHTH